MTEVDEVKVRRRDITLSDVDMTMIRVGAETFEDHAQVIVLAWEVILGTVDKQLADFDDVNRLDPKMYRLPQAQWEQICVWLIQMTSGIDAVNGGLDWVNVGPSAREES